MAYEVHAVQAFGREGGIRRRGASPAFRVAFQAAQTVVLTVHNTVGDDSPALALPPRLAQERTVNAAKHARPDRIDVFLSRELDRFVLEVNEDRFGIDTADVTRAVQAGHVGLAMVRRRVEDAGSPFAIEPRQDDGTRSRVVVPVRTS